MPDDVQPTSLARVRASNTYAEAAAKLAEAATALHAANKEYRQAMQEYFAARGAARSQGVIS